MALLAFAPLSPWAQSAADAVRPHAALARQRDAQSLLVLSGEGKALFERDVIKLDGYGYCGRSIALAEQGEFRQSIRAASKALHLGIAADNEDLRALAQRAGGSITEQSAIPIVIGTPSAAGAGSFAIAPAWLQRPGAQAGGIAAEQGIVVGSSVHAGLITLADGALTAHADLALNRRTRAPARRAFVSAPATPCAIWACRVRATSRRPDRSPCKAC